MDLSLVIGNGDMLMRDLVSSFRWIRSIRLWEAGTKVVCCFPEGRPKAVKHCVYGRTAGKARFTKFSDNLLVSPAKSETGCGRILRAGPAYRLRYKQAITSRLILQTAVQTSCDIFGTPVVGYYTPAHLTVCSAHKLRYFGADVDGNYMPSRPIVCTKNRLSCDDVLSAHEYMFLSRCHNNDYFYIYLLLTS